MSNSIQIVIVDDHPLFRDGVALTLQSQENFEILAQGTTAAEAVQLSYQFLPDLLLLDINIPGGGLNVIQKIAEACPVTKIVMLTASEAEEDVLAALKAGARGYIVKGVAARELVSILRAICAGEAYVTPSLAASLLSDFTGTNGGEHSSDPLAELTRREQQILEGVAAGLSNKEIGQKLSLSEKTVKHYVTNILQKLHVRNRVEAALLARGVNHAEH
jgi:two-component system, NarL family, nitrate/nitrite response regulator NarL